MIWQSAAMEDWLMRQSAAMADGRGRALPRGMWHGPEVADRAPVPDGPPPEHRSDLHLSSVLATPETVKASLWPWFEPFFTQKSSFFPSCSLFARELHNP